MKSQIGIAEASGASSKGFVGVALGVIQGVARGCTWFRGMIPRWRVKP